MFKTVVLVCALSTPQQDCTRETALDVVAAAPAKNETMCGFFGQAQIATTAVRPEMGKSYAKVICERTIEVAR